MQTTQYGDLQLSTEMEDYGPKDGLTLDAAIELLVQQNLDLEAARLEIPMADADVLTANLRANPIFYADTQLIPYGHFSFLRPGGPPQSDVNINYPLDITFKRQARTRSAREAKNVTEAQLQDFVRNSIDNLYTVYEDDVAAGLTVKFSEVYATGIRRLLRAHRAALQDGPNQGGRPAGGQGQRAEGRAPAQGGEASEDQGEPRPRSDVEHASHRRRCSSRSSMSSTASPRANRFP